MYMYTKPTQHPKHILPRMSIRLTTYIYARVAILLHHRFAILLTYLVLVVVLLLIVVSGLLFFLLCPGHVLIMQLSDQPHA